MNTLTNSTITASIKENQLNNLKNKKVYLKHFEDMDNVYILEDVLLFNEIMLNMIQDKCKL